MLNLIPIFREEVDALLQRLADDVSSKLRTRIG
jgi:hypothetical protein